MTLVRQICMVMAGAILLLHSLLPHEHHRDLDDEEHVVRHEMATSLVDFIKLAFHLDQGEDHLENFKVTEQFQLSLDQYVLAQAYFTFAPKLIESQHIIFPTFQATNYSRYLSLPLRFRGPPHHG